jgi:hypothetical protein
MADRDTHKKVKVGVKVGGGPPPGYQWNIEVLDIAYEEAREFLDEDQYEHLASQFRELARQVDPTHSETIDVRPIEDFHELRDKWGILRRLNVRVFFLVHKERRTIVVLGAMNKQNEGPTPLGDRVRARFRMRHYLESLKLG